MSMAISGTETAIKEVVVPMATAAANEVELMKAVATQTKIVNCVCCGLTEECTQTYIFKVRERYQGRWICGLCAEAVKDESNRSAEKGMIVTIEEALNQHMNFCKKFKSSTPPPNPTGHLISAVRQLVRRSLDSPTSGTGSGSGRVLRSTPSSPDLRSESGVGRHAAALTRCGSCFPSLARAR